MRDVRQVAVAPATQENAGLAMGNARWPRDGVAAKPTIETKDRVLEELSP